MLNPQKSLDTYYLEARRDLLEVAAMLDRYDEAVKRTGSKAGDESKKESLIEAMKILTSLDHPNANRTEQLLVHFAKVS
jgi:hypothetical protein